MDKTSEAFHLMRARGICPMPMMMHHDSRSRCIRRKQLRIAESDQRSCAGRGAVSLQVLTAMTPSPGTKLYEGTFTDGLVIDSAGGKRVEPSMCDGNYVVASRHARPWRKQLNLLTGYLSFFYNPLWFIVGTVSPLKPRWGGKLAGSRWLECSA